MTLGSAADGPGGLRFSVLGPLAAEADGVSIVLGPRKRRLTLAALLVNANRPVSVDLLSAMVWEDEPPRTFRKNIQVHVAALRQILARAGAPGRLRLTAGGYELRVAEPELDLLRFRELARTGREALSSGALTATARSLRQAWTSGPGRGCPS